MLRALALSTIALRAVLGDCPNGCSGNGLCREKDQCLWCVPGQPPPPAPRAPAPQGLTRPSPPPPPSPSALPPLFPPQRRWLLWRGLLPALVPL